MKYNRLIILGVILIILDRFTKYYLGKINNTGAGFGILQNYNLFLIVFSLIILILISYLFIKSSFKEKIALTIIVSGTISNLIDRILYGSVIDFINLKFWPLFNLADIIDASRNILYKKSRSLGRQEYG